MISSVARLLTIGTAKVAVGMQVGITVPVRCPSKGETEMGVPRGTARAKRRENMAAFRNWRRLSKQKAQAAKALKSNGFQKLASF